MHVLKHSLEVGVASVTGLSFASAVLGVLVIGLFLKLLRVLKLHPLSYFLDQLLSLLPIMSIAFFFYLQMERHTRPNFICLSS